MRICMSLCECGVAIVHICFDVCFYVRCRHMPNRMNASKNTQTRVPHIAHVRNVLGPSLELSFKCGPTNTHCILSRCFLQCYTVGATKSCVLDCFGRWTRWSGCLTSSYEGNDSIAREKHVHTDTHTHPSNGLKKAEKYSTVEAIGDGAGAKAPEKTAPP